MAISSDCSSASRRAACSGTSLVQDLIAGGLRTVQALPALRDKLSRAAGASLPIEQGQVYLPEHAPWLDTFIAEVCAFPVGRHDDQVDAMSQALSWIVVNSAEPALLAYYRMRIEAEKAQGRLPAVRRDAGITCLCLSGVIYRRKLIAWKGPFPVGRSRCVSRPNFGRVFIFSNMVNIAEPEKA